MTVHASDGSEQDVFGLVVAGRPFVLDRPLRVSSYQGPTRSASRITSHPVRVCHVVSRTSVPGTLPPARGDGGLGRAEPEVARPAIEHRSEHRGAVRPWEAEPLHAPARRDERLDLPVRQERVLGDRGKGLPSANRMVRSAAAIEGIVIRSIVGRSCSGIGRRSYRALLAAGRSLPNAHYAFVCGGCLLVAGIGVRRWGRAGEQFESTCQLDRIVVGICGVRIRSPRAHAMISAPCSYPRAPVSEESFQACRPRASRKRSRSGRSGSGRARCGPSRAGELGARSGRRAWCRRRPRLASRGPGVRRTLKVRGGTRSRPRVARARRARTGRQPTGPSRAVQVAPVTSTFGRITATSVAWIEREARLRAPPRSRRPRPRTR